MVRASRERATVWDVGAGATRGGSCGQSQQSHYVPQPFLVASSAAGLRHMHGPCFAGFVCTLVVQALWLLGCSLCGLWEYLQSWFFHLVFLDCSRPERLLAPAQDVSGLQMLHVAYTTEKRLFPDLLLSMVSLSQHLHDPRQCTFHVIVYEPEVEATSELLECFRRSVAMLQHIPAVIFHGYQPDSLMLNFSRYDRNRRHPVTDKPMTWARLRLDRYLPTVPRVLYLDTDTIVKADVRPLYQMRMRHAVAAAQDSWVESYEAPARILLDVGDEVPELNISRRTFFSSGVMLLDLERWRQEDLGGYLDSWVSRIPSTRALHANWHDQDLLNVALQDRRDLLDWRWNVVGMAFQMYVDPRCVDGASILHFSPKLSSTHWLTDPEFLDSWGGLRLDPFMEPLRICPDLLRLTFSAPRLSSETWDM